MFLKEKKFKRLLEWLEITTRKLTLNRLEVEPEVEKSNEGIRKPYKLGGPVHFIPMIQSLM